MKSERECLIEANKAAMMRKIVQAVREAHGATTEEDLANMTLAEIMDLLVPNRILLTPALPVYDIPEDTV